MNDKKEIVYFEEDPSLFWAPSTLKNCFLTWLVPSLGYWMVGRKRAAVIMTAALLGAFFLGVVHGGDLFPFFSEGKIRSVGAFCQLGMGFPYMLVKWFSGNEWLIWRGSPLSSTYDYGTNYFLIAGMLNWLSVLDVYDISVKRK